MWVAIGSEVPLVQGHVLWAMEEHVLDCLDWLAALASNLFGCVAGEESLCEQSNESMSCCKAVESGVGRAGELSFNLVICILVCC